MSFYSKLRQHMMMNNDASPLLQFSEHLQKAQAIILSSHHFLCAKLGQCMVRSSLSWSEKTHSHSSFEDDLWLGFCDPFFSRLVFSRPVFVFYPDWTDRSKTVAWNTNLWKQVVAPWKGLQPQTFEDNGKYDNNKNGKCLTMDYLSVTLTLKCIHTWTSKCAMECDLNFQMLHQPAKRKNKVFDLQVWILQSPPYISANQTTHHAPLT